LWHLPGCFLPYVPSRGHVNDSKVIPH
jgi:hypothetical protein